MVIERTPLEDELGDVLEKALRLAGCDVVTLATRTDARRLTIGCPPDQLSFAIETLHLPP